MNSFGRLFRLSIVGESHSGSVGIIIDGCPPGIALIDKDFDADLSRRKSGPIGTSARMETDLPVIKNGVLNSTTTGAPLYIEFQNSDKRPDDYDNIKHTPRPGHADFTAYKKYSGFNDYRGGGHFSGRLTVGIVAAGVVAKKIMPGIEFTTKLIEAGGFNDIDKNDIDKNDIDKTVESAIRANDSIGGIIECRVVNIPAGLGEPYFDSIESALAHAVFSIPGIKGIEFGAGFAAATMTGSQHNDSIIDADGSTSTNNSGGINGGISNGNELVFRVAVKPASSIPQQQGTIDLRTGNRVNIEITGRHDACFALRVPVIVEAAAAIVLADFQLIRNAYLA